MRSLFAAICSLVLFAAASFAQEQILLWPSGAPGSEGKNAPETMRISPPDEQVLSNINFPSITPFLPDPVKENGVAVIVIPGGGHRDVWITHEGYRVAEAMRQRGIAAFVLRYRLYRAEGSTYTLDDELKDVQRALRLVKSRAAEWKIDPERVGVMGFSAGGQLSALAGTKSDAGNPAAADPIDRFDSRPAFLGLIYAYLPPDFAFTKDTPPAFFIFGDKDDVTKGEIAKYEQLEQLGVPAELHVLSGVAHGFGIRPVNPPQVTVWPETFVNWLDARGFLKPR
jgi:endo-1,4-beta-xylanase